MVLFKKVPVLTDIDFKLSNILNLVITIILISILVFCFRKKHLRFSDTKCIILLTVLFFSFEVLLVFSIPFKTGWDVGVIFDAAYFNVFSKANIIFGTNKYYFDIYPNNIFLLLFEMSIAMFTKLLGRGSITFLILLCLINCIIYSVVGILVFYIQKKINSNSKLALFSWICYMVLVGTSPWILVPYSDSLGLLFPTLIFSFYLFLPKNSNWKWFLISIVSFLAYQLKPQLLIIFIAIILISFLEMFSQKNFKKMLHYILIVIFAYLIVTVPCSLVVKKMGLDETKKVGISHFLMMGMNYDRNGVYSDEDVSFSTSIADPKERFNKNIEVFMNRVSDYGLAKTCRHFYHKILVNFNDGTFFYGREGGFYSIIYSDVYPEKFGKLSWLREFFYYDGKYYFSISTVRQGFWLFILMLLGLSIPKKGENKYLLVLKLSLLGLFLFELLFEARSRYLFTFVPIFVIVALDNFYHLLNKLKVYIRRKS